MRWLMIGFLVSLAALLVAAAGAARHIWLQRDRLRSSAAAGTGLESQMSGADDRSTGEDRAGLKQTKDVDWER